MAVTTHRTRSGVEISYAPFSAQRLEQQLTFTEITAEDLRRITSFEATFVPRIPQMVDAFYDHLWQYAELRAVVEKYSSVPQLKKTLEEYLQWFMRGKVDQEYANYRYRVGAVHDKIGLAPHWYLGMFHIFETHIINMICEGAGTPQQQAAAIGSWMKLLSFDMQLAMDAYIQAYTAERVRRIEQLQGIQQTLASSSHDLAASSEELSASSEEMVSSVAIVAHDSQEMQQHTQQIERTAAAGVERMQQVADTIRQAAERMAAMREKVSLLADSSREMEKILKTVDGIAKQTNLLSLNAAIEAARAGQHGRGFAVVADEVRKLSDRTSASLKEISKLIATSDRHVDDVRATAEEAGQIAVAGANESTTAEQEFAEIARLVAESATRIGSITEAMSGLAEMSDNLKGSAESNAHLATTLAELAQNEG